MNTPGGAFENSRRPGVFCRAELMQREWHWDFWPVRTILASETEIGSCAAAQPAFHPVLCTCIFIDSWDSTLQHKVLAAGFISQVEFA